jgi:Holliday junction resolvasome RuvABC DNA-binding subunit
MQEKRDEARRAAAARAQAAEAKVRARAAAESAATEQTRDVIAGLRTLGFRADEARRAAALTETMHDAGLEERMRAALRSLGRRPTSYSSIAPSMDVPA